MLPKITSLDISINPSFSGKFSSHHFFYLSDIIYILKVQHCNGMSPFELAQCVRNHWKEQVSLRSSLEGNNEVPPSFS
jgi:hypothetical protein